MSPTDQQAETATTCGRAGPHLEPIDRKSLNLPNLITSSRFVLALVVFVLIDITGYELTAAGVFVLAAGSDALDGYVARRYGMVTTLGRILDPFVDKFIICGAFVFLLEKNTTIVEINSGVTSWIVAIVIGREMFVTSLRGFMEQQGVDFSATSIGKWKMILQCSAVTVCLLGLSPRVGGPAFYLLRDAMLWLMVAVTAWSGVVYGWRAVVLLRRPSE